MSESLHGKTYTDFGGQPILVMAVCSPAMPWVEETITNMLGAQSCACSVRVDVIRIEQHI